MRTRLLVILSLALATTVLPLPVAAVETVPETRSTTLEGLPPGEPADVSARQDGSSATVSRAVETPMAFSMLGARIPEGVAVGYRTSADGQTWSEWQQLQRMEVIEGPDPADEATLVVTDEGHSSEPVWVGEARWLQTRVTGGSPADIDFNLIDSLGLSTTLGERITSFFSAGVRGTSVAEASTGLSIISRAQWGANESRTKSSPSYATVRFGVVHHTAGSNSYRYDEAAAVVRGIHHYHTGPYLGWSDIGYNLLVDRWGRIYEGRAGGVDRGVVGAHARGFNTGSFGISLMGNFDIAAPPKAAIDGLVKAAAWKARVHQLDMRPGRRLWANGESIHVLTTHNAIGQTACPGRYVIGQMSSIRQRVHALGPQFGVPLMGDWDGDGIDTPGWFTREGRFLLRNSYQAGAPVHRFRFGRGSDVPVAGDWNGDGRDTIGVRRGNRWFLRNANSLGDPDRTFYYGTVSDRPVVGDWNGDGRDTVGVRRSRTWHLRNINSAGRAHASFAYGLRSDRSAIGDWDGNRTDTVGVVRGGGWYLQDGHGGGRASAFVSFPI